MWRTSVAHWTICAPRSNLATGKQFQIDKAENDISRALDDLRAAQQSGDGAAQGDALRRLDQAGQRFQQLTGRGPGSGDHLDPPPPAAPVWDQPGSTGQLPTYIKPEPETGPGTGGTDQPADTNPDIKPIPTQPTTPPTIGYIGGNWHDIPSDDGPDIQT